MAANASAVPTVLSGAVCMNSISTGTVIVPPPTPVIPMASEMMNPSRMTMSLARDVYSALELLAGPAPRTRIRGVERQRSAGLATDAGVAALVQRKHGDFVLL